jgi:hypothetical protein
MHALTLREGVGYLHLKRACPTVTCMLGKGLWVPLWTLQRVVISQATSFDIVHLQQGADGVDAMA